MREIKRLDRKTEKEKLLKKVKYLFFVQRQRKLEKIILKLDNFDKFKFCTFLRHFFAHRQNKRIIITRHSNVHFNLEIKNIGATS